MKRNMPKSLKLALGCLAMVVGSVALCLVGMLLLEAPRFIVLPISFPVDYDPWDSTTYAVTIWSNFPFPSRYFVWRREALVLVDENDENNANRLDSWSSIVEYFDGELAALGWERHYLPGYDPCALVLPEANFLTAGENGYVTYFHKKYADVFLPQPVVCLAIWPSRSASFYVVIGSSNPSPLTRLMDELE